MNLLSAPISNNDNQHNNASSHTTLDGVEIITALIKDRKYSLIPVTVENAKPLNYEERRWDKERQLEVGYGCVLNFLRFAQTNKNSAWLLYFLFASRLDNTYNPFQLTGSHVGWEIPKRRRKYQFGSDRCSET